MNCSPTRSRIAAEHALGEARPVLERTAVLVVATDWSPETRSCRADGRTPPARCRPFLRPASARPRPAYRETIRSRSQSSASLGKERCAGSRTRDGATTGSQSPVFHDVRRPRWVSWIITAQSCSCTASTSRRIVGHDRVVVGVEVAERRRAVLGDEGRAGRHRQRQTALRLLGVVPPVPLARHAVLGVRRLVGRRHHSVLQPEVLELERFEQRIAGHRRLYAQESGSSALRRATKSCNASSTAASIGGGS